MKLDEMDERFAEEQRRAELNRKLSERWLGEHNRAERDIPRAVVQRSLFCQNYSHAACRWAECKCVCHETADLCGTC